MNVCSLHRFTRPEILGLECKIKCSRCRSYQASLSQQCVCVCVCVCACVCARARARVRACVRACVCVM